MKKLNVELKNPHSDKIVIYGISCVGKTTFAKQIGHHYYCFDALFPWHDIEFFGMSISKRLQFIKDYCIEDKYVLDGWHPSDLNGTYLPNATIYCLFAEYDHILSQYRIPFNNINEFQPMFRKWYYDIQYDQIPNVRYWFNDGSFHEVDVSEFQKFKLRFF